MQCEPIIEEPATPEPEYLDALESAIEDAFWMEDPVEIPVIKLNIKEFMQNVKNYIQEKGELQDVDMSKALVARTQEAASIPMPKVKNASCLQTEYQVWTEESLTIHVHIFLHYGHQVKLHNPFSHLKLIAPPNSLVIYAARRHALHAIACERQMRKQSRVALHTGTICKEAEEVVREECESNIFAMPSEVNPAPLPTTMGSRRGRKKKTEEERDEFWSQRPDWLPEGWTMNVKVRKDGATAGIRDRYFYEQRTGHRFRSRKEVEKFIKTGEFPRYKPRPRTRESNVVPTSSQNSNSSPSSDMVLPPTLEFYIKNLQSYMSGGNE